MESITIHAFCLILFLSSVSLGFINDQADTKEDLILKAYESRIQGNEEEAQSILEGIINDDPTNAMAHFEMARTVSEKNWYYFDKAIQYDNENTMYKYYMANLYMLWAYQAMHADNLELVLNNINRCTETLQQILKINPECKETLLFLVDIYGTLTEEEGGNNEEAHKYLKMLHGVNPVYASRGELILATKEIKRTEFWQEYIDEHGESTEVKILLGKSWLLDDNIDQATTCFEEVLAEDPAKKYLYLDLARAYIYRTMRGGSALEVTAPQINKYFNLYLDREENKPANIEAWCYGWLSVVEEKQGNAEQANLYLEKANKIHPNFSRATAIPETDQPPNVIAYSFSSYFSPF